MSVKKKQRTFAVTIHSKPTSKDVYHIRAQTDILARKKAISIYDQDARAPGYTVDFCEIVFLGELDA